MSDEPIYKGWMDMPDSYDFVTLMCRLKAAQKEVGAFKSGEKYVQMKALHLKDIQYFKRTILKMQDELARAHSAMISMRDHWFEVFEDLQKEFEQKLKEAEQRLIEMEKRALRAERERDDALDKVKELRLQFYQTASELEKEKGINQKLRAQLNRDFENSSISSSKSNKHKKIANSREKTGRAPGGQPGHTGHGRKKQEPTKPPVLLAPPPEVLEDPDFKKNRENDQETAGEYPSGNGCE